MDKDIEIIKQVEEKPVDELGDLDEQLDDLIYCAERAESQRQRFTLMVDATSSMGYIWSTAKDALKCAVDQIKASSAVPIQIQVVAYRDHEADSKEHWVEASDWSDDSNYLKDYISGMRCHGGGDYPESIGHGLAFTMNQQLPSSQIILIGDAPSKPGSLGYAEAQQLGQRNCPIYALYTNEESKLVACFHKLARLSGGKAFYLQNLADMDDILKVLLASNKVLGITYQPTSIEGKRMLEEIKR